MYKKESKINFNVAIIATIFLVLVVPVVGNQPATTAQAQTTAPMQSINLVKSGLVASDSLTTGDTSYWTPWGSTINTPLLRDHYEDSQGLHIGVQAPYSGKWVNYGFVSPDTNASLFHAVVTNNHTSVSDGNVGTSASVFEAGLYVLAPNSNYVGCIAVADFDGHYWAVHQAYGSQIVGSGIITTLYKSPLNTMPLTQDCTIITNGDNSLKVYLGDDVVFSSSSMDLRMPTPFKALLQVDSSSPTMRYGTFLNYYTTSSEGVTVTYAPPSGTVKIVNSSNNTLASAPVTSDGTATMLVGMYSLPLVANIEVYNSTNTLIASTSNPMNIFGGDVYSVPSSAPQPPTGLTATAASSSQINLSWTAPANDGGSPVTGYMIERSVDNGATWSTIVANTASTSTAYSDTGLALATTYSYRVSTINSVGTSAPSSTTTATTYLSSTTKLTVNTQNLNGDAISGLWIQLYKDGALIDGGSSPVTFTLNTNELYTVVPNDWIQAFFDHWLDTGSTTRARDISISDDTTITAVYSAVSQPPTSSAPQPPTGLTATAASSSQINLSWAAPANDGDSPVTGYMIERSVDNGATWSTIIANTGSTTTAYSDTGLSPNTTYTYRVSAINSVGTSAPSNTASATTQPGSTTTSTLTVNTQNLNGDAISGLWIQLYKDGALIDGGSSPVTFTLNTNELYTVVPNDWAGYIFDHWLDTGSTNRARDISLSTDTTITAVYRTIP